MAQPHDTMCSVDVTRSIQDQYIQRAERAKVQDYNVQWNVSKTKGILYSEICKEGKERDK